jgi:hypothetical protein
MPLLSGRLPRQRGHGAFVAATHDGHWGGDHLRLRACRRMRLVRRSYCAVAASGYLTSCGHPADCGPLVPTYVPTGYLLQSILSF